MTQPMAPAWQTADWFNTSAPLELAQLRGKVVVLHAFQMLCPGCVAHAIPQAKRVAALFADAPLAVVGLHTVFEHHSVTGREALRAFLHEYRIGFPVGIDAPGPDGDPIPRTMHAYAMQGTPTTVLIDAQGRLRRQVFGAYEDLLLGAEIGSLLAEVGRQGSALAGAGTAPDGSSGDRCATGLGFHSADESPHPDGASRNAPGTRSTTLPVDQPGKTAFHPAAKTGHGLLRIK